MKMTKTEREAFKKSLSDGLTRETDIRKSNSDSDVEIKDEKYCFAKYLRGATLGDWTDADTEYKMFKTYAQSTGTTGGFLVPEMTSNKIIEYLDEVSVIRSMPGVQTIDMKDKMVLNRVDSAVSTSWGEESVQMSEDTNATFGQVSLELKKLKSLQKLSRELLENANPSVDDIIINQMVSKIGLAEDLAFLEGTSGTQPLGFYYHPNVKNTDLSAVLDYTDFLEAMYQVEIAHGKFNGWVGNPREKNTLRSLKDGNGNLVYADGRITDGSNAEMPSIYGYPLKWTTTIPITLRPGANESYIVGGDWSNLLIGHKPQIRIETTDTGGDAFEYDQVFIKAVRNVGTALLHPDTFAILKGIQA